MARSLKSRMQAIDVIIDGSKVASTNIKKSRLDTEFMELMRSSRAQGPRRDLLLVLHTSRMLDSFLVYFIEHHSVPSGGRTMGSYLFDLRDHQRAGLATLGEGRRHHHQTHVVDVRNQFMHQAGVFPSRRQADELLSSMHVCLSEVASLA